MKEVLVMQALLTHVAGVDVHKEILVITVLIGAADAEPKGQTLECSTYTDDLKIFGQKLLNLGVKHVAMESTGIYWKPVHNVWSPMGLEITLGNATHMKNVPGRKTDVNDSHWIALLHRNGLIRSSYVPEAEFQELRALNRHRTNLVEDIARVKNRVQKVLEDGNVKIGSVLSNVFGVAGIDVLDAIAAGETDADVLLSRVTTSIRKKEDLKKALTNCLKPSHRFLIGELMQQYVDLNSRLSSVEQEISDRTRKHADLLSRLTEIPGVDRITAQGILAEATTKMEMFADDRKFAAWAGVAPGNNESAGKKKDRERGMAILR